MKKDERRKRMTPAERQARLAEALRENLRKRKDQARQRSAADDAARSPDREGGAAYSKHEG
jgi:hypothetical protein